jgi:hypothetical protein
MLANDVKSENWKIKQKITGYHSLLIFKKKENKKKDISLQMREHVNLTLCTRHTVCSN